MGKKINEVSALTDSQAKDNSRLMPSGDPTTGITGSVKMSQVKLAIATVKTKYIGVGGEGTIIIPGLAGMEILMIAKEGGMLYEVTITPDPSEFTWDGTTITLGLAANTGERFLILSKYA